MEKKKVTNEDLLLLMRLQDRAAWLEDIMENLWKVANMQIEEKKKEQVISEIDDTEEELSNVKEHIHKIFSLVELPDDVE
jgi:hypothetical protein